MKYLNIYLSRTLYLKELKLFFSIQDLYIKSNDTFKNLDAASLRKLFRFVRGKIRVFSRILL